MAAHQQHQVRNAVTQSLRLRCEDRPAAHQKAALFQWGRKIAITLIFQLLTVHRIRPEPKAARIIDIATQVSDTLQCLTSGPK